MTNYEEEESRKKMSFNRIEERFFNRNNEESTPLPSEGLRIVKNKLYDIRGYATKHNYDDFTYECILREACEILRDFYLFLDTNSIDNLPSIGEETEEEYKNYVMLDVQGKPRKLWRLYKEDTFTYGSKLWNPQDEPERCTYSPFDVSDLNNITSSYLDKEWIRHPYLSWSIINAYLIHVGRTQIMEYDVKYSLTDLSALFFIESIKTSNRSSTVGIIFDEVLETESDYNVFIGKVKKVYPRLTIKIIAVVVAITAVIKYFTDYQVTSNVILCLGLCWSIYDLICSTKINNKKLLEIDRMRNLLVALKEAWVAANNQSVDLTRIKDKVAAAEKMGYRFPIPFHALLTNTIAKYGNTISVNTWASY